MRLDRTSKIAVLMGGVSNEREISFKSGKAIATALSEAGHDVVPVDVTDRNIDQLDRICPRLAFVALHGEYGEDGEVQAALEQKGIPYTGSGPEASRMGMDKVASKRAFVQHSVPTPDYMVVEQEDERDWVTAAACRLGYPLVCKPKAGGSSLGISMVHNESELGEALSTATEACHDTSGVKTADTTVMLESYVHGREFTVGVLDGLALPIVEIISPRTFFDYEAKYSDENTRYVVPVALLETVYRRMQEAAIQAYHALGCRHLARVDMLHGYDGRLYVLEVNTIPGFTPRSLLPMAAEHAGMDFQQLCENICAMSIRDAGFQDASRQSA
jgi:D-alanine-D-alanine ligase